MNFSNLKMKAQIQMHDRKDGLGLLPWVLGSLLIFAPFMVMAQGRLYSAISCRSAHAQAMSQTRLYHENQFPESPYWLGGSNPDFGKWAARTAQMAAVAFDRGQNFLQVLNMMKDERFDFHHRTDFSGHETFKEATDPRIGQGRLNDYGIPYSTWMGHLYSDPLASPNPKQAEFVIRVFQAHPSLALPQSSFNPLFAWGLQSRSPAVQMTHTTLDGRSIPSTILEAPVRDFRGVKGVGLNLIHPESRYAAGILQDVINRVDRLLEKPNEKDFALAMHGYFNAMPFRRGSAAIGRLTFAGLYLHLFGRTITLPGDVDILAMTSTPEQFANMILMIPPGQ